MRTIWKYTSRITDTIIFAMPKGAEVIHVDGALDEVSLWAIVDVTDVRVQVFETRHFAVRGTGRPLRQVGKYLGSYSSGPATWHVFEAARTAT